MPTCPCCQHHWTTPKKADALSHPGPNASDTELRAYYKATAPRFDILFALDHARTDDVRKACLGLLAGTPTAADARRMFDALRSEEPWIQNVDEPAFWRYWSGVARRAQAAGLRPNDGPGCGYNNPWPPSLKDIEQAEHMQRKRQKACQGQETHEPIINTNVITTEETNGQT